MYMSTLRRLSKALRPKVNVDGEIKMKRAFSQLFSRFLKWLTQVIALLNQNKVLLLLLMPQK